MNQPVINSRIIKLEPVKWLELQFIQQETREDVELIAKSGQSTAIYELK